MELRSSTRRGLHGTRQWLVQLGCGLEAFPQCIVCGRGGLLLRPHYFAQNSRADGQGSVGIDDESVAEAVRRRVWKILVNLFSNLRLDELDAKVV